MNQNLEQIRAIRSFNRSYTNLIGLMNQHILDSEFTLQEIRILFEINAINHCSSKGLKEVVDIDGGYLSRVLKKLEKHDFIKRQISTIDKRVHHFELTKKGLEELKKQEDAYNAYIHELISHLNEDEKNKIVTSMKMILTKMGSQSEECLSLDDFQIRESLSPGDLGYLTYLHGKIYKEECHYDLSFEGYVSKTFYEFTQRYSEDSDRFFIAEKDGTIVGSIAILGHSKEEAQLRWFLIVPEHRGIGLGKELFDRALQFCETKGYKKIWLLTTSHQKKASSYYRRRGFKLTKERPIKEWGCEMIEEKYTLERP